MRLDSSDMRLVRERTRAAMAYADDKFLKARRAKRMREWYRGEHYTPNSAMSKILETDRVVVNYSLVNVLVKIAEIAFGDPTFSIKAKRRAFGEQLRVVKPILEYVFKETKAMRAARMMAFDAKVTGTGVVGTNWRLETAGMVYRGGEGPTEGAIIYDNPEARRIKPEWWVVDPDSPQDWRNGWYAGEKWQVPLLEIKRHPRYEHIRDKLKGTVQSEYARAEGGREPSREGVHPTDDHLRRVEGYTVYLRDLQCMVDWSDELPDEPLFVGEVGREYPTDWAGRPYYPYVCLINIPDLETHYGLSDIEITETQQAEIDLARSQLASVRRQNNGQLLVVEGALGEEEFAKLQLGTQGAIIVVQLAPGQTLKDIFGPVPRENIQPEVYASIDKAQMDMSELSRATAFKRGMAIPGVKFATEAMLAQQGSGALEADERKEFERAAAEIGEQFVNLLHTWVGESREIQLPGGMGEQTEWLEWSGRDVAGDFEFLVEPGTMQPPDTVAEEQKWFTRMQALAPLAAAGVNIMPLVEAYLESFDFPDIQRVISQPMVGPEMGGMMPPGAGGPPGDEGMMEALLAQAGAVPGGM